MNICNACNLTFYWPVRCRLPHAHVECAPSMGHTRQKKYPLIDCEFILDGVVFMFLHDILYIDLLYCVANF